MVEQAETVARGQPSRRRGEVKQLAEALAEALVGMEAEEEPLAGVLAGMLV